MHDPIFDIFQAETRDNLKSLEQGFLDLDVTVDQTAREHLIDKLFRHAHNIKGDARALDLRELQTAAANLEETLERLRRNHEIDSPETVERGLRELDQLISIYSKWLSSFQEQVSEEASSVSERLPSSEELLVPPSPSTTPDAQPANFVDDYRSVRVPSDDLDQMLNSVGEVRVLQRSATELQRQLNDVRGRLEELLQHPEDIKASLESAVDQIRRIETKLNQHQSRERLQIVSLEEQINKVRLLPLSLLADMLRRPIRDLSRELGKEVRFRVDVGNVQLDKGVIDALRTPFLHLIRNALDHGLEAPAERLRLGKPRYGTITLKATRRGGKVIIYLSDDGAGAGYDKIRHRLISQGLLSEAEVQELNDAELSDWLFQPGFSTARVGEISGRGVGLDVVRDTLQRIQGTVHLTSESGQGATFTLTLPMTISTIRVLTVWCNGQSFGLPSSVVYKAGRVKASELRELKGAKVILVDDEPVRWVWLGDLLQQGRSWGDVAGNDLTYVVVQLGTRRLAVQVDVVDEEREVLLKPLGFPLRESSGVLGGTIRPDGSVQIVLDISLEQSQRVLARKEFDHQSKQTIQHRRILVVDDSPTTRALLRNVLATAGYRVQTAIDGLDALDQLRMTRPDLVISDFEMPRLNGVDLTRQIKSRWKLPVILVTGREQEHFRREGLEAGADAYFVKSTFQDESLLDLVRQMIPS